MNFLLGKRDNLFIRLFALSKMISNYYIYYSYKTNKDTLFIYFDNENDVLTETKHQDVSAMFRKDGKLHSYRINNITKVFKIKNEGFIFNPNEMFLKVINFILENAGFETLKVNNDSKYVIGKIASNDNGYLNILYKNKSYYDRVNDSKNIDVGDAVVIALPNAILSDFTLVKDTYINGEKINCHICNEKDLNISENDAKIKLNFNDIDKDFFSLEEHENAWNRIKKTRENF